MKLDLTAKEIRLLLLAVRAKVRLIQESKRLGFLTEDIKRYEKLEAKLVVLPTSKTRKLFATCIVERCQIVTSDMTFQTDDCAVQSKRTVTAICNTPLFGYDEKKVGVCKSCLSGLKSDDNYPTIKGLVQIDNANKQMSMTQIW